MVDYKTKPSCFGKKDPDEGFECIKCAFWIDGCFLTFMQESSMRPLTSNTIIAVDLGGKDKTCYTAGEKQEDGSIKITEVGEL